MFFDRLTEGSKIGIFSSSFPGSYDYSARYLRGKEFLRKKGFEMIEGNLIGKKISYLSGLASERGKEINSLVKKCDCLISTIGGYNSNSVLQYIDYALVKNKKPIIIGFSDTTIISLAIYSKTNIPTFMSQALIPSYGEFEPFNEINYNYFKKLLVEQFDEYIIPMNENWTEEWINWEKYERPKKTKSNNWKILKKGYCRGILIGGNLDSIISIIGTEYMPQITENTVLLIEETSIGLDHFERNLTTLALHGYLKKIKGLIVSKFEKMEGITEFRTVEDIIKEYLSDREIPILMDFDCGHTHPSALIPIGGEVEMDLTKREPVLKVFNTFF